MKSELLITDDDLRKYPFLPIAIERVKELGLTLADMASGALKSIIERASQYIEASIRNSEISPPAGDCDEEIISFMTSLLVLKLIGDRLLVRRFATTFARRTRFFLSGEELDKLLYLLNSLGIKVRYEGNVFGYPLSISVFDYLDSIPERRGSWKLVHRVVDKGWVYVNRVETIRLGEERLRALIEKRVEEVEVEELQIPDSLYSLAERLSSEWGTYLRNIKENWEIVEVDNWEKALPPCVKAIIDSVKAGKNIPHSARFMLASFMLNIGLNVEEVLEVFRVAPDFKEQVTRYQIEHIAGMRGSRKKYSPYKCDNMKTLGLCIAECGVKHPLQYYWKSLRPHIASKRDKV
ncbi:MAG: hypothetical protein QXY49_02040 [Thermofilaceae archaeon]